MVLPESVRALESYGALVRDEPLQEAVLQSAHPYSAGVNLVNERISFPGLNFMM